MRTKIWLITAACLVLVGCIIFAGVMWSLKWDFTKLSTVKYETNSYEIGEAFSGISIKTDTADITFALSNDGKCRVECFEEEKAKHLVAAQNNTLVIKATDNKAWYDYIGINFNSPKITVYLPKTEYASLRINQHTGTVKMPEAFKFSEVDILASTGDIDFCASAAGAIKIKTSTGDIGVKDVSAASLSLSVSTGGVTATDVDCSGDFTISVSTGKAKLTDVKCQSLASSGDTGDITLLNVIAAEKFTLKRSTGDVKLTACDAAELFIETDTGDVLGTLLSDKVFITKTDTGRIAVPNSVTGGRCEITTDTGDIKIAVEH